MPVRRGVEENDSAAMLATKRSADAAPEVNLTDHQVQIRLPNLALKPRGDITSSPK